MYPYAVDLFVLCRYQGHVSAALVLGGYDVTGPHLHTVSFISDIATGFVPYVMVHEIIIFWSHFFRFIPMDQPIRCHSQQWDLDLWQQWQCLNQDTKRT
jgi:hypothetical protein